MSQQVKLQASQCKALPRQKTLCRLHRAIDIGA
jgi:hypothetical protein